MTAPTPAELREGLVEVPAAIPTFASEGLEPAASAVAGIAADAHDYLAVLLDRRPDAQVVVLNETDWTTKGRAPLFGLPNASDGSLVWPGPRRRSGGRSRRWSRRRTARSSRPSTPTRARFASARSSTSWPCTRWPICSIWTA